jgi:hypothetical protein
VFTNKAEERVFFTAKVFIFQEVTIKLSGNADEMPVSPNYTIDDVGAKSVVMRSNNKLIE